MDEFRYVVNVDCAVVRDDEYLFIERAAWKDHAAGTLAFPGGKVEQDPGGEHTFEETAVREVREEVGLEVDDVQYVYSTAFESDDGVQCINVLTTAGYVEGEADPTVSDEVDAVYWLSVDEIRERDAIPAFLEGYVDRVEAARESE